jgi:hypothetical protein
MSSVFDKVQRGLIITCLKKRKALPFNEEDVNDAVQDIYEMLWKNKDRYDPERGSVSKFVNLQVAQYLAKKFATKKSTAKQLAKSVDVEEVMSMGVPSKVEEEILLEELRPHIGKELQYFLTNPYAPDYARGRGIATEGAREGGFAPVMTKAYIGEIMGKTRQGVEKAIKRNVEKLKELV